MDKLDICFDNTLSIFDSLQNEKEYGTKFTKDGYENIKDNIIAAINSLVYMEIIATSKKDNNEKEN